jgi:hypothetical protein
LHFVRPLGESSTKPMVARGSIIAAIPLYDRRRGCLNVFGSLELELGVVLELGAPAGPSIQALILAC